MDQNKLLEIASYVTGLKMFPYFDAAHYVVMCLMVRDDIGVPEHSGSAAFSRKHPLACWVSSMLMCFATSIVSNFLVGESLVIPLKNHQEIVVATAVWYVINYSPYDVVYKVCKFAPVRLLARAMDQLHVTHHIHHGVNYALKHYTAAHVIAVIIGIAKGAGHCFMRPVERVIRGVWKPSDNILLFPSFEVKACLMAAVIFVVQMRGVWLVSAPFSLVYLGVVLFLIYFDLVAELVGLHDPLSVLETAVCSVLFTSWRRTQHTDDHDTSTQHHKTD